MYILEKAKEKFLKIIRNYDILNKPIQIRMVPLLPEEVVGKPKRDDYPLLNGKEVMIEAVFKDSKGQAFTDEPSDFSDSLQNILNLSLTNNRERAIFVSTLNAIMRHLKIVNNSIHCKNFELEDCAKKVADFLFYNSNIKNLALVGLQPGFALELIKKFGKEKVFILDLNPDNIGKKFHGVEIIDSSVFLEKILKRAHLTLATGSTIVNNTIDNILNFSSKTIFYGVTIAGVANLLDLERLCFNAH